VNGKPVLVPDGIDPGFAYRTGGQPVADQKDCLLIPIFSSVKRNLASEFFRRIFSALLIFPDLCRNEVLIK